MNVLICAVFLAASALANGIVLPEGFELPSACASKKCGPGLHCVESPNLSPFCVLTPCQNIARCIRRPAVQPALREENMEENEAAPLPCPSYLGSCPTWRNCASDKHCPGDLRCCANACGGRFCIIPEVN